MLSDIDKKIIHEIALNHFVKDGVVEDIILSIEHNIADIIENADVYNGNIPIINVTNFGKFVVSLSRQSRIKGQNDKRNKNINEGQESNCEGASNDSTIIDLE